jgi:hypothetical protein
VAATFVVLAALLLNLVEGSGGELGTGALLWGSWAAALMAILAGGAAVLVGAASQRAAGGLAVAVAVAIGWMGVQAIGGF